MGGQIRRTPHAAPGAGPGSDARRPDVQGLRALAVVAVVVYHATPWLPGGFVGVDAFFVISGFVITGVLLRERRERGRVRLGAFYVRRFWRLSPALAVTVAVTMALSVLLLAPFGTQQVAAKTGIGATLLGANAVIATSSGGYFDPAASTNPLLHTWSLSVEEQFYLVFPWILVACWAGAPRRSRRLLVAATVGCGALLSFAFMLAAPTGAGWLGGFYSPLPRAWEFAVGALVALVPGRLALGPTLGRLVGALGLSAVLASTLVLDSATPFPGPWTLLPVLGTAAVILAGADPRARLRPLVADPVQAVGDRSYSIYLWHWPFIVLAATLLPGTLTPIVAAALSLIAAWASYRYVEQPLRRPGPRRRWRVAVAVPLVPLLAAGCLGLGARAGWGDDDVAAALARSPEQHPGYVDCLDLSTSGGPAAAGGEACTFNGEASGAPVHLVGDSNAAQYSEAVLGAARATGRPLTVATAAGCPFSDVHLRSAADRTPGDLACRDYYERTSARLRSAAPSTVVIAASASGWLLPGREVGATTSRFDDDDRGRAQQLEQGMRRTVAELTGEGHRVVLVLPMFWLGETDRPITLASCPTLVGILADACPSTVGLDTISPGQRRARADVGRVARETGSVTIDILDVQCPDRRCGPTSRGVPTYADTGHISTELARVLVPRFIAALEASDPARPQEGLSPSA